MKKLIVPLLWLFPSVVFCSLGLSEGDSCYNKGIRGTCKYVTSCPHLLKNIRQALQSTPICSFEGNTPIVCCTEVTQAPLVTTTRRPKPSTTTEYTPEEPVYVDLEPPRPCPPLSANLTAPKTTSKAWNKCLEYQDRLVFPCEKSKGLAAESGLVRGHNCKHNYNKLITGGVDSSEGEFPHMVVLSYNTDVKALTSGCGGSLISEWFILTAAHCTYKRLQGPVQYAIVGVTKLSLGYKDSNVYKIAEIKKHHNYASPVQYNDIALLKTEREITLYTYAVPACLDVGSERDYADSAALATGWGALLRKGQNADTLQKVVLNKFTDRECAAHYPVDRRKLPQGFDRKSQACYGDKVESRDSCPGDSGGPLQVKIQSIKCMYAIIGLVSLGHGCGYIGVPGLYLKVRDYVPWIESVVWP